MALRLAPGTLAQLAGLAWFFAGIPVAVYGIAVLPQQWESATALSQQPHGGGGIIESPLAVNVATVVSLMHYAFLGALMSWAVAAFGIGIQGRKSISLATLLGASAALGAIGSVLVLWWARTCQGTQCYPTALRDMGIGLLISFAGLSAFAAVLVTKSLRSPPRPVT